MKIKIETDNYSKEIDVYGKDGFKTLAEIWIKAACQQKVMYEPTWLGIPIIQFPEDILMMQELLWKVRPDVIVEAGVAHGGSAVFYASILEIIGKGRIIGVDVEIRQYNKVAIKSHPMSKRIQLIEGSSVDTAVFNKVLSLIKKGEKVLVVLDSNHSYAHVKKELELYHGIVSNDSYLVAMDGAQGLVWDIPSGKKEWKEDNPLRAINEFLDEHQDWEADANFNRLPVTSNPKGYLKRKN